MASVKIATYEFLKESFSNPGFVVGDIIEVFIETTTLSISPYLNGVLMTFDPAVFILNVDADVVAINDLDVSFCNGADLIDTGTYTIFPFGTYYTFVNHSSCAVNPPTCDILVNGIPSVIGASDALTPDGSFTVNGTSSNPIEYKIGSNFIYGDGTAQSSGTFSGLLPGTYNVFLRDSVNCFANVQILVPIENTFGVRMRLDYTDDRGNDTRIDVLKRGYDDEILEVCGSDMPFTIDLRAEGEDDKFKSLVALTAVLSLTSEVDNIFSEFYTNDPNLYRLYYYKDFGSGLEQKNTFKCLPQLYQSDYKFPPYYISVNATDGLAELNDNFLIQPNGQLYYGTISLIKLIAHCLSVNKLNLEILVACNLYAVESSDAFDPSVGMDTTDSDDPLDQSYIDFETFYLATEEPTITFVLRTILDAFGCRIVQSDNRWNIIRIEEAVGDIDYRLFDSLGDYVSNGTINIISEIGFPSEDLDVMFEGGGQNFSIKPGFGRVRAIYNMGLKPNVLNNGDFRLKLLQYTDLSGNVQYAPQIDLTGWLLVNAGYPLAESYEELSEGNVAYKISSDAASSVSFDIGKAYIQSEEYDVEMGASDTFVLTVVCKIPRVNITPFLATTPSFVNAPFVRVRVIVQCGSNYMRGDGTWSSTANVISFVTSDFDKFNEFQITGTKPPTGGALSVRVYHAAVYYAEYTDISDVKDIPTYDIGTATDLIATGHKLEIRENASVDIIHFYEFQETTDADNGYLVIRPDDYNGATNAREWVEVGRVNVTSITGTSFFSMSIDKVQLSFLTNGKSPFDKIIRTKPAEASNKLLFEKEFFIGSYSTLIVTESSFTLIGKITLADLLGTGASLSLTTTSQLNAAIVYTGWLRNSDGEGFKFWKRDGIAEEDYLHGLALKSYAGQYKNSFRALNASFYVNSYFRFINVLKEVNDSDTLYLPMSLSLDDKRCRLSGESFELTNIYANPGSDGSGESPLTSGFTIGFGSSGYN